MADVQSYSTAKEKGHSEHFFRVSLSQRKERKSCRGKRSGLSVAGMVFQKKHAGKKQPQHKNEQQVAQNHRRANAPTQGRQEV